MLTKADEDLFALNDFDRVIEVSQQILERKPPVEAQYQRTASTLLAHSLFDRGRFGDAERAYVRVQGLLPANDGKVRSMWCKASSMCWTDSLTP